jgi:Ca2+-binding EF-hand superfamily protein
MALALFILAAVAAAQPVASAPPLPMAAAQRAGRPFMSPMGEPVFGRTAGEDGLTAWFQETDSNHDGSITRDEMKADADRFFGRLDSNHDGEIDPDEVTHYEQVIAPELHSHVLAAGGTFAVGGGQQVARRARAGSGRRGGGGGGGGGGVASGMGNDEASAGRYGLLQIPEPVASADADFNRGVSAEEFRRAAAQRFGLLDSDHTGRLTLSELQGIHEAAASAARRPQREKSADDGAQLDPRGATEPQR